MVSSSQILQFLYNLTNNLTMFLANVTEYKFFIIMILYTCIYLVIFCFMKYLNKEFKVISLGRTNFILGFKNKNEIENLSFYF